MTSHSQVINNDIYDELGERWYTDNSHAIAILRIEAQAKLQYIKERAKALQIPSDARIIDIGCGAGFVSNPLAELGYTVKGVDMAASALATARKYAPKAPPIFEMQDALNLKEENESYDVVVTLDFLEHTTNPTKAVEEAFRVLKPGGVFFYQTFNRTPVANLLAVKSLSWFTKDCPENLHVYSMFIKPAELEEMIEKAGGENKELLGLAPNFIKIGFWHSLFTQKVQPGFCFKVGGAPMVSYLGYAIKK